MGEEEKSYFDKIFFKLKNNKFFAWIMIVGVVSGSVWAVLPKVYKDQLNDWFSKQSVLTNQKETRELFAQVEKYYSAYTQDNLNIGDYFSPQVKQFITAQNPSRAELDRLFSEGKNEYQSPYVRIIDSTFVAHQLPDGANKTDYWISFKCFRKSKQRYQSCLIHAEMIFDNTNKIISYRELEIKDLVYTNKQTHYTGNVGNLVAKFDLDIDHNTNTISGTYYYPKRKGIIYSLVGNITGTKIELTEYTNEKVSAKCNLSLTTNACYSGVMKNTDGKVFDMNLCPESNTN